jgi:hypothetical protein
MSWNAGDFDQWYAKMGRGLDLFDSSRRVCATATAPG